MATSPRLLLLDEPAAGMNPHEANELMDLIRWIRDHFGMAILLVEHNMKVVMGICETVHVLDYGATIAVGHAGGDPERPEGHRGLPGGRVSSRGARSGSSRSRNLSVSYGAIQALKGVSLASRRGRDRHPDRRQRRRQDRRPCARSWASCRPPGARSSSDGRADPLAPTFQLVREGLILVPEGRAIFANLTVHENLELGAYARRDGAGSRRTSRRSTRSSRG